ncbi:Protein similar to predicted member of the intramitochondrial sorting protein family [Ceraceosorus bombacis]|uniref:Protein similar to predicted member of the intramitochondrial sorting protein family n=1 Tax=Ceraceosorus bombacis TaxID=401625 RepID=A0A0P1BMN3_9BASI|nr:Protein similar to predicted member of the intramitochondrial sorting protein family [Ceraceosorus bombacis]
MPQEHSTTSSFQASFSTLVPAYFERYPNPLANHVICADVIDRRLVPLDASSSSSPSSSFASSTRYGLRTTRLILKKGTLPAWAPKGILRNSESWVLEESLVELDAAGQNEGRRMHTWTRNLDHTTVLAVTEGLTLTERISSSIKSGGDADVKGKQPLRGDQASTGIGSVSESTVACLSRGHITSSVSPAFLARRIEKFGLKRFVAHAETSHDGLLLVHAALLRAASGEPPSSHSTTMTKRGKLAQALRPPFLDGYPPSLIVRARRKYEQARGWWKDLRRGGTNDETLKRERPDGEDARRGAFRPADWLRSRLVGLRGTEERDRGTVTS